MSDKLSKIFDMEPVETLEALPASEPSTDVKDDSQYARDNIKQLISTANSALEYALDLAKQSESPRAFEVLANMLNTTADLNKKLIEIHQQEHKLNDKVLEKPATQNITNNVVFSGTSSSLNELITKRLQGIL